MSILERRFQTFFFKHASLKNCQQLSFENSLETFFTNFVRVVDDDDDDDDSDDDDENDSNDTDDDGSEESRLNLT